MATKTVKRKLSELVFDYDLYPRESVDAHHAGTLQAAIRAGEPMPPFVIDAKSKRVVDGFHRAKAYRAEFDADHVVECIEREYKNEGEMFLDAMRLNARHGRSLTKYDRARCMLRMKRFRLGVTAIAAALGMSVSDVKAMAEGRVAKVEVPPPVAANRSGSSEPPKADAKPAVTRDVPLKRTIEHKSGQTLTAGQQEANTKLSGMDQSFYVNQILLLVENDLLDKSNERLMERLRVLHERLDSLFASV